MLCRRKAQERRAQESDLRTQLEDAQQHLQADPQDPQARLTLTRTTEELETHEDWKLQGQRLRARVRWKMNGDWGSKEFFSAVRPSSGPTATITSLLNQVGELQTSQAGIQGFIRAYMLAGRLTILSKRNRPGLLPTSSRASLLRCGPPLVGPSPLRNCPRPWPIWPTASRLDPME
jgi:hypothetical protein